MVGRWASAAGRRSGREGGRERASLPARRPVGPGQPAQSVSAAAGARPGPSRTILTAAPPAARAPVTLLRAAGARGPFRQGAEPVAAARLWRGRRRPAAQPGRLPHRHCGEEAGRRGRGTLGSRRAAHAPPSRRLRFFRGRWACAAFLRREETLPSLLCDIRLHSRADVWRYITSLPQRGAQDSHTMTPSSCFSSHIWTWIWQPKVPMQDSTLDLRRLSVFCGLMVNTEMQQSMTAISGLYSALKQFPFLYVHLDQFVCYLKSMRREL
ncbi:uncharacterized protein LOC116559361 [Sapajus apella]|uniref:Uncharacterized protein LOC116559361 n=1 Tax=Sapajus apella TaxID=9515 RepID=A0A6J3IV02_SAPAP|nr:uncharacterized protein LOC116559361 [Sapajus apella]